MSTSARTLILAAAAALMLFGAAGFTFVVLPDLHGDLVEIGVRPSVLGGTVLHLYFAGLLMFGCASIVAVAAVQSSRDTEPATAPLVVIAVVYAVFGAAAFSRSHNPHHLGPLLMSALVTGALVVPAREGGN
jgi:hypothetical protein